MEGSPNPRLNCLLPQIRILLSFVGRDKENEERKKERDIKIEEEIEEERQRCKGRWRVS